MTKRYLYGVSGSAMLMLKTEILKEGKKTYTVADWIPPYVTKRVYKNSPNLAFDEAKAINVFVANHQDKITNLKEKIADMEKQIAEAMRL